jgi:hypothetical protein
MGLILPGIGPKDRAEVTAALNAAWQKALNVPRLGRSAREAIEGPAAMRRVMADADVWTDGHWPLGVTSEGIKVIGCECGWKPKNRPQRASMQHVPHQTHRRGLKLRPVNYEWPTDDMSQYMAGLSAGGYVEVRNAHWDDESASWVKDGTLPTITVVELAKALKAREGNVIANGAAMATAIFKEARG